MDGEGMRADALEDVLENWDVEARGAARPHVLYTVPIGQNPCGTTMGSERKKAIYDICVKYDVIIVEDDPYFSFKWESMSLKVAVIAPGSRLGWFTCNPLFAERLERLRETSTQAPSGFSQILVTQLLSYQWGYSGYIRWLRGIRIQYTLRRDEMLDGIAAAFDIEESRPSEGEFAPFIGDVRVLVARSKKPGSSLWRGGAEKEEEGKILFSFVPPIAGMFAWLKVHLYNHPAYSSDTPPPQEPEEALEYKLWDDLALNQVLFVPGWLFGTDADSTLTAPLVDVSPYSGGGVASMSDNGKYEHYRVSFSDASPETIAEAMKRFAHVMDKHFS